MASLVGSLQIVRLAVHIWAKQSLITKDSTCEVELHKVYKTMVMVTARTETVMTWRKAAKENVAPRTMSMGAISSASTAQRRI